MVSGHGDNAWGSKSPLWRRLLVFPHGLVPSGSDRSLGRVLLMLQLS